MDRQAGVQEGRGNVQVYFTLEYTPAEESAQVTRRPRHASDLDIGGGSGSQGLTPTMSARSNCLCSAAPASELTRPWRSRQAITTPLHSLPCVRGHYKPLPACICTDGNKMPCGKWEAPGAASSCPHSKENTLPSGVLLICTHEVEDMSTCVCALP